MSNVDEQVDVTSGPSALMPSGARMRVMNLAEQRWLEDTVSLYMSHHDLTNISDLKELDRLILLELQAYRYGMWLGAGQDYDGDDINERQINDQLSSLSTEIRLVKRGVGLDRPARERAAGEGSTAHYWAQLQIRAKRFGIMRVKQLDRALELTNYLIALVQAHDNAAHDTEREAMRATTADIMEWIRDVYIPEFQQIDAYFREHEQSIWIRSQ